MDDDQQTITALRSAADAAVRGRRLPDDAARRAWAAGRAPRRPARTWLAVAATVVGVGAGATAVATWRSGHSDRPPAQSPSLCTGSVSDSALPEWARTGFGSSYDPPHVTGLGGEILGVLFTQPLRVRQPAGRYNKVLWVARDPGHGPLTIRATLEGTSITAVRTVAGGPGPSYLNLPRAGCWTLDLRWSGHRDIALIPYAP